MSLPPLRGRRTRERRVAERVAEEFAARHPADRSQEGDGEVDFDIAEVDAEVADARREEAERTRGADAVAATPAPQRTGGTRAASSPKPGRRLPDLSALPPLLHASGALATLRDRLGRADASPSPRGHHAGLVAVPHGAKTYLAAALAIGETGERLVWIARDAEIGDRVAEELQAWLGDPGGVAVLEPRTALAYERSVLVPDETAARVAALAAWRGGRARVLVASVQALLQHTIAPADLPASPRTLRAGSRISPEALLHDLLGLGYEPVVEVAGRGEFARRGGIVDVFPPSRDLPVRIEFFGDEIDSLRAFDPTDQRSTGRIEEISLLPATEFLLPHEGVEQIRVRLGKLAARLPERLSEDLRRFEEAASSESRDHDQAGRHHAPTTAAAAGGGAPPSGAPALPRASATRALAVGEAAEVWAGVLAPSAGLDHVPPGTLLVLDEPADIAEAAEFLWRQAGERATELVASGELHKDWSPAYLPPRDWKSRLLGSRTLELTWESETPEGAAIAGGGLSSGDLFGWREPELAPGRTARLGESVERWQVDRGRIVLASDQSARLAEILAEADHPVGVVSRLAEAPPTGALALVDRSLNGGFAGGPDGLVFVTDRELFGSVRVRRPKALRRVVPRICSSASRRATSSSTSTTGSHATSGCCGAPADRASTRRGRALVAPAPRATSAISSS